MIFPVALRKLQGRTLYCNMIVIILPYRGILLENDEQQLLKTLHKDFLKSILTLFW